MLRIPLATLVLVALFVWLFRIARRVWIRVILAVAALVVAAPLAFFWSLWIHDAHMKVRASDIRAQLEAYRTSHGEYPVSLLDVGVREVNGPIWYERDLDSPLAYHLSFEYAPHSLTQYDSNTHKWDYNP